MSSFIVAMNGVSYILIILFISRMILSPRDFYFNPILKPIDMVTTPVLNVLEKIFPPTRTGLDFTPLISIIIIYVLKSVAIFFLDPSVRLFSKAFLMSFADIYQLFLKLFMFSAFVKLVVRKPMTNPLFRFFSELVSAPEKIFGFLIRDRTKRIIAAIVGVIFVSGLVYLGLILLETRGSQANPGVLVKTAYLWVAIHTVSTYKIIIFTLIFSVILSWLSLDIQNPLVNLTYAVTEPLLRPLRRIIPTMGGLDFSPWAAGLIVFFIGKSLMKILVGLL